MHEPYLAVCISNGTLSFTKKIPSEDKPREIFELNTDEVMSDEFDEACRKLGSTVFGILRLWHPEVLNSWGKTVEVDDAKSQVVNDFDIAMQLISKSVFEKTKIHVQSIDVLLREQAEKKKAAKEFLDDSWPTIRERLEKFN
jgi:hypothetical protein